MNKILWTASAVVLVLAACTTAPPPATPSETIFPETPTATPTPIKQPSKTPSPSQTPAATATPFWPSVPISASNADQLVLWRILDSVGEKIAFSSDGELFGVGGHGLDLYRLPELLFLQRVEGFAGRVYFSANLERIGVVEVDQDDYIAKLRLIDPASGEPGQYLLKLEDPEASTWVEIIDFSPSGNRIAAHTVDGEYEPIINIYSGSDGGRVCTIRIVDEMGFRDTLDSPVFDPSGRYLAGAIYSSFGIQVFDSGSCQRQATLQDWVPPFVFAPDGRQVLFLGNWEWNTVLVDIYTSQVVKIFETGPAIYSTGAFGPNEDLLALANQNSGEIELFNLASAERLFSLEAFGEVIQLAFSPYGLILAALHAGGPIAFWAIH